MRLFSGGSVLSLRETGKGSLKLTGFFPYIPFFFFFRKVCFDECQKAMVVKRQQVQRHNTDWKAN